MNVKPTYVWLLIHNINLWEDVYFWKNRSMICISAVITYYAFNEENFSIQIRFSNGCKTVSDQNLYHILIWWKYLINTKLFLSLQKLFYKTLKTLSFLKVTKITEQLGICLNECYPKFILRFTHSLFNFCFEWHLASTL